MGIENLVWGVLGGAAWGLVGFSKARKKGESFNATKFTRALVVGAATGAYAAYTGQELDLVAGTAAGATVTAFADSFLTALWTYLPKRK